jgi:hypothetical protein
MATLVIDDMKVVKQDEPWLGRWRFDVSKVSTGHKVGDFFITYAFAESATSDEMNALMAARYKEFGVI